MKGPGIKKPSKDDISGQVNRLKNLSASFNTELQKNKWDVIHQDTEDFLTTDEVQTFYLSDEYQRLAGVFN